MIRFCGAPEARFDAAMLSDPSAHCFVSWKGPKIVCIRQSKALGETARRGPGQHRYQHDDHLTAPTTRGFDEQGCSLAAPRAAVLWRKGGTDCDVDVGSAQLNAKHRRDEQEGDIFQILQRRHSPSPALARRQQRGRALQPNRA